MAREAPADEVQTAEGAVTAVPAARLDSPAPAQEALQVTEPLLRADAVAIVKVSARSVRSNVRHLKCATALKAAEGR